MAKLNNSSVNTLRIVTDRIGDDVHIAYITVKIGRAGSFVTIPGKVVYCAGLTHKVEKSALSLPMITSIYLRHIPILRLNSKGTSYQW